MSPVIHFDLELALLIGTIVTGIVWLLDKIFLGDRRRKSALERSYNATHGQELAEASTKEYREPWFIDLCKSFFPILLIVLLLRSFVAEPFRIPSGSMMPTLLHGDFILVNKFTYGIRLPVWHKKIIDLGKPERGDVAVFRFPKNPADDYIKRVIGLPGDHIAYRDKKLYINGKLVPNEQHSVYQGEGANSVMNGVDILREDLDERSHDILLRKIGYKHAKEFTVPLNHYFVMGDNRDHSSDSREWGFVPEENLVGQAFLVWMNWDFAGKKLNFSRVGRRII